MAASAFLLSSGHSQAWRAKVAYRLLGDIRLEYSERLLSTQSGRTENREFDFSMDQVKMLCRYGEIKPLVSTQRLWSWS